MVSAEDAYPAPPATDPQKMVIDGGILRYQGRESKLTLSWPDPWAREILMQSPASRERLLAAEGRNNFYLGCAITFGALIVGSQFLPSTPREVRPSPYDQGLYLGPDFVRDFYIGLAGGVTGILGIWGLLLNGPLSLPGIVDSFNQDQGAGSP